MKIKNGLQLIMVPLKIKGQYPLMVNPFIKQDHVINNEKIKWLDNNIKLSVPTSFVQNKLAIDINEKKSGSNIIYFENLLPLQYWLGNTVKIALIVKGLEPTVDAFNLDGRDLSNTSLTILSARFNEFLFAMSDRPHIINIMPNGRVHSVHEGKFIAVKEIPVLIRKNVSEGML